MTTFSIRIDYTTGHSLHSERVQEEVGMNWKNVDQAKKALQYIKEHYEAYKDYNEYNTSAWIRAQGPFDMKTIMKKPWYHGPLDGEPNDTWNSTLVVEKDDGEKFGISVFWVGYFEKLHVAEVCIAGSDRESNDMRIFF